MHKMKKILTIILVIAQTFLFAQITIDIHPNFKHTVGEMDSFNRTRMLKIHADQTESEWTTGNNLSNFVNLRDTFLNGLDVYMGRNTGGISYYLSQVKEDPARPGFADPADIASKGASVRNSYSTNAGHKLYEFRNELVIAAQQHPFYPDGMNTSQGWSLANGFATGEYMGRYINEFHGSNGQPKPTYIEIMNEPLYDLVDEGPHQPIDIFNFHNDAADAIREQVADIPIGGYCAAFPNFEQNDFQRWHERMKLFMDTSGDKMDFWAIHFYDFNGTNELRRGANIDATLDMIDHYSLLSFGEIKPYVISEYGGRARNIEGNPWTPYRDWQSLKSWTSMLLTFSERPQDILSAIPFVIVKALWGTQANGNPYPWRLLRQTKEESGETGLDWVYTDMVKFFQLWSDVKGTRIDTRSTDPDIQTNAFVDDNKMYLIVNNLYFDDTEVDLNVIEHQGNIIQNIRVKHLYLNTADNKPILAEENYSTLEQVTIGKEAAMIIEYTYQNDIVINELVEETKYFADSYLTKILPFTDHNFNINGVIKEDKGEAVLRLGMGRPHGRDLQPTVKVNGLEILVPSNYAGYDQTPKGSWFGVIEVPVPLSYLKLDNEITVRFADSDGHISSMSLQMYNHSNIVFRSDNLAVTNLELLPAQKFMLPASEFQLAAKLTPGNSTSQNLTWESSDNSVASVDDFGKVTTFALGSTTITLTDLNSGLSSTGIIEVVDSIPFISVVGINVLPSILSLEPNETHQLTAVINPTDATDQSVTWSSANTQIVTVDANGLVQGNLEGTTEVTSTTVDGGYTDVSVITVVPNFATNVFCSLLPDEVETGTNFDFSFSYSSGFNSDVIVQLRDGSDIILGEDQITGSPGFSNIADIQITTDVAPIPGDNYSFHLFIKPTGVDSILFTCIENLIVTNVVSTTSVQLTDMKIYPNPTNGIFTLEIPNLKTPMMVEVVDVIGKSVLQQKVTEKINRIEMKNAASGVYFVRFNSKLDRVNKRIIVN